MIITSSDHLNPPVVLVQVMFDSFLPIPQSDGIRLKQPTAIHPSTYFADPPFIVKLKKSWRKIQSQNVEKISTLTDASLPWGGRLDIDPNHEWDKPHAEHWNGNQCDIRLSDMFRVAPGTYSRKYALKSASLTKSTTEITGTFAVRAVFTFGAKREARPTPRQFIY